MKRHAPVLVMLCLVPAGAHAAELRQPCSLVVAKIVSIQGTVLLRRADESASTEVAKLDMPICQGDLLQTGAKSRAAIVILPEKFVRIDQNSTISVTVAGEETLVEFSQTTAVNASSPSGAYFITRFPRKFKVHTPYLNAAVEGTEFLIDLSSSASAVAVFEGKVRAE
ncbi:MAG: FecR family protein, partial [Betaproteobacteria bacterium]